MGKYGGTGFRKEQEVPVVLVRQWPAGKLEWENAEGGILDPSEERVDGIKKGRGGQWAAVMNTNKQRP